jgi:hypothetical protein
MARDERLLALKQKPTESMQPERLLDDRPSETNPRAEA